MNDLSIDELVLGLRDLLGKRGAALARITSAASFKKLLEKKLAELEALPPALRGLPRTEVLRVLDQAHDRYLRALNLVRGFFELWPDATPAMRQAAVVLKDHFVAAADESTAPYAVQAQRAVDRAAKLPQHAAVLDLVKMPDDATLTTWVGRYLAKGQELGETLSGRADDLAARGEAPRGYALRSELIGLLGDLRTALRRDLEADPELPRSLNADVFGYLDELQRLAAARRLAESPPPVPPPTVPTPVA